MIMVGIICLIKIIQVFLAFTGGTGTSQVTIQ